MTPDREFQVLCVAANLGTITPEEFARLEQRLATDAVARRYYVKFVQLQGMIDRSPGLRVNEPTHGRTRKIIPLILALAACFVGLVGGAAAWFAWSPVLGMEDVRGPVTILRKGRSLPATNGIALRAGDVIRTEPDASATVAWRHEKTSLRLESDTVLRLASVADGDKRFYLLTGTLTASVAKQPPGQPMLLETRFGRLEVIGTRFELSSLPDRMHVNVESGSVILTGAGQPEGRIIAFCQAGTVGPSGHVEVKTLPPKRTAPIGLMAHWPLNEGKGDIAHDTSGNGLDASIQNPRWTTDAGKPALLFSPNLKKHASVKSRTFIRSPELALPPAFTITLWLWMNREDSAGRLLQTVFSNSGSQSGLDGFSLLVRGRPSKPAGTPGPDEPSLSLRTDHGNRNKNMVSPPMALATDSWRFLAVKIDRSKGRAEISLDGKTVCTRPAIGTDFSLASPLFFGVTPHQYNTPLKGKMRDIRIYKRLLDPDEIRQLADH